MPACMPLPRNMRTPVYEERTLSFPPYDPFAPVKDAALPLGLPRHKFILYYDCLYGHGAGGLQLATNGDILVGRTDNGKIPSPPSS